MPAPKAIALSALVPVEYDNITLAYDGDNLETVTYVNDGTTVATLTLSYDGTTLTGISRS